MANRKRISQPLKMKLNKNYKIPEKSFSCDICSDAFKKKSELKQHAIVHGCKQSFECDICGLTFSKKFNFRRHYNIHSNEKPYACDKCGQKFRWPSFLKEHENKHLMNKLFRCQQCNVSFTHRTTLRNHMFTHTGERPHMCDICGKRFSKNYNLKLHRRLHTGDLPFQCDQCHRSFNTKSNLKNHSYLHTGIYPFVCDVCTRGFRKKCQLLEHYDQHVPKKPLSMKLSVEASTTAPDLNQPSLVSQVTAKIENNPNSSNNIVWQQSDTLSTSNTVKWSIEVGLNTICESNINKQPISLQYSSNAVKSAPFTKVHENSHSNPKPLLNNQCPVQTTHHNADPALESRVKMGKKTENQCPQSEDLLLSKSNANAQNSNPQPLFQSTPKINRLGEENITKYEQATNFHTLDNIELPLNIEHGMVGLDCESEKQFSVFDSSFNIDLLENIGTATPLEHLSAPTEPYFSLPLDSRNDSDCNDSWLVLNTTFDDEENDLEIPRNIGHSITELSPTSNSYVEDKTSDDALYLNTEFFTDMNYSVNSEILPHSDSPVSLEHVLLNNPTESETISSFQTEQEINYAPHLEPTHYERFFDHPFEMHKEVNINSTSELDSQFHHSTRNLMDISFHYKMEPVTSINPMEKSVYTEPKEHIIMVNDRTGSPVDQSAQLNNCFCNAFHGGSTMKSTTSSVLSEPLEEFLHTIQPK